MRFRKKPVVIDAVQWFKNGDHPEDRVGEQEVDWFKAGDLHPELFEADVALSRDLSPECFYTRLEGAVVRFYRHPDMDGQKRHCDLPNSARPNCTAIMHDHGWIDTIEGGHTVCPGDWIITGVEGERYPCEPNIFDRTYEPAEDVAD